MKRHHEDTSQVTTTVSIIPRPRDVETRRNLQVWYMTSLRSKKVTSPATKIRSHYHDQQQQQQTAPIVYFAGQNQHRNHCMRDSKPCTKLKKYVNTSTF
jgi:hypothetical protein